MLSCECCKDSNFHLLTFSNFLSNRFFKLSIFSTFTFSIFQALNFQFSMMQVWRFQRLKSYFVNDSGVHISSMFIFVNVFIFQVFFFHFSVSTGSILIFPFFKSQSCEYSADSVNFNVGWVSAMSFYMSYRVLRIYMNLHNT